MVFRLGADVREYKALINEMACRFIFRPPSLYIGCLQALDITVGSYIAAHVSIGKFVRPLQELS